MIYDIKRLCGESFRHVTCSYCSMNENTRKMIKDLEMMSGQLRVMVNENKKELSRIEGDPIKCAIQSLENTIDGLEAISDLEET